MLGFLKRLIHRQGGPGDDLAGLTERLNLLEEDYAAFKEVQTSFRKRMGMRWARSGASEDATTLEELKKLLQARPGANGARSQHEIDFGEL